jgi:hypothetical protein
MTTIAQAAASDLQPGCSTASDRNEDTEYEGG